MRPATLTLPVLIFLNVAVATAEPPGRSGLGPTHGEPGVIDSSVRDRPWDRSCMIHRSCQRKARRLPRCRAGTKALTVAEALSLPGDGRAVSVKGPLNYGESATTAMACGSNRSPPRESFVCCNHTSSQILVGETPSEERAIFLQGVGCSGDESRQCCDLVVRGQWVVATGELHEDHYAFGKPSRYSLGNGAKVCALGRETEAASTESAPQPEGSR